MAAKINQIQNQEEMRDAIERVLNSKYFSHAPMKQKFLRLICEFHLNGRGGDLNEYLIGREVFDRDDSYNPSTDPIVRVGAHGVREKLALYYQKEGLHDEIRIDIPIGSYEPVFIKAAPVTKIDPTAANPPGSGPDSAGRSPADSDRIVVKSPEDRRSGRGKLLASMGLAIAGLAITASWLFYVNRGLNHKIEDLLSKDPRAKNALGAVWQPFLNNPDPTLLILSNPAVHRPVNGADPEAVTRRAINLTPEQASILTSAAGNRIPVRRDGPVQLIPAFNMYTGIGEAIGVYRLSGLLQSAGEVTILKQSRSVGPEDLKSHDVILLGSVYANQWSKPLSVKENFIYTSRTTIENLEPREGELREYRASFNQQTGDLAEDYALITVTPGVSGDKTVMVLAGIYSEGTEAAAEFMTNSAHLNELNNRLRKVGGEKGPPRSYQLLIKASVENSFPTRISLVTIRELQ